MPSPPSDDSAADERNPVVPFPSGVLATLGARDHAPPLPPLVPDAPETDRPSEATRHPVGGSTPHHVFAVGLPASALGTLLRSCAVVTDEVDRIPGGGALLPSGRRLPSAVDVRALAPKPAVDTALEFLAVEMAAGVVGENADRLRAQARTTDQGADADYGTTPTLASPPPVTARSGGTGVSSRQRPRTFPAIRSVPTDSVGRPLGVPAANLDHSAVPDGWPEGPERGAAEPPVVFVDDLAFVVLPGPDGAVRGTDAHPYDARNRWLAVRVAEGEAALDLHERYRRGWAAGDPVTVHTPAQDQLVEVVVASLGPAVGRSLVAAFGAIDVHVESIRRRGGALRALSAYPYPVLRFKQVLLLVAAYHGVLGMDLRETVRTLSLVGESTLAESRSDLVDLGLLATEKAESDTAGPKPRRLVLGDRALDADGAAPDLETLLVRAADVVTAAEDDTES